ncbi:hypothetical protein PAMP_002799 [Pampus punctatissimus]
MESTLLPKSKWVFLFFSVVFFLVHSAFTCQPRGCKSLRADDFSFPPLFFSSCTVVERMCCTYRRNSLMCALNRCLGPHAERCVATVCACQNILHYSAPPTLEGPPSLNTLLVPGRNPNSSWKFEARLAVTPTHAESPSCLRSLAAVECFEWCHLDIVAAPAADSECIDGGEILPMIEDFKVAELSQKA